MTKEELALELIERLKQEYPDAGCTLDYNQAWKLLVSVRLAAQCTDARVNVVVQDLYAKYPDVASLAEAPVEDIEAIVRPCGLGRSKARDISGCMKMLQENVVRELEKAYSGLIQGDENLSEALAVINAETGNEFVIIFDEWDYPIRELAEQSRERQDYIEFLRMMFKNAEAQDYVRLAYLTGILPMVRAKGQSAVNNFDEYTMIDARDLGGDIGFVEEEVQALCEKCGVSAAEMKYWYDGYDLGGVEVYNPLSVVRAVESGKFRQYWTETGTYEDIRSLIEYDFDGLREAVIQMLSGNRIFVNVYGCKNDMYTFRDKDQVITTLIHLGYFAYDADTREAYVPNKEIREIFYRYMENNQNDSLSAFLNYSKEALAAVLFLGL